MLEKLKKLFAKKPVHAEQVIFYPKAVFDIDWRDANTSNIRIDLSKSTLRGAALKGMKGSDVVRSLAKQYKSHNRDLQTSLAAPKSRAGSVNQEDDTVTRWQSIDMSGDNLGAADMSEFNFSTRADPGPFAGDGGSFGGGGASDSWDSSQESSASSGSSSTSDSPTSSCDSMSM